MTGVEQESGQPKTLAEFGRNRARSATNRAERTSALATALPMGIAKGLAEIR